MSRRLVLLTVVFCGGALVFCCGRNAFAEPAPAKEKAPSPAAPLVQQALDNEVAGDAAAHKELLQQAVALDPDYPPARWHLGEIRWADAWLPAAEAIAKAADSELTAQYQAKREEAAGNAALELKLAQWCVKNGMPDRARLHFWGVLKNPKASEAQLTDAAKALDLVSIGGMILTRQELKQGQDREKRIADAIGKYRPILAQLQPAIDGGFDAKHETAAAKLAAIDDPAVIPAIETYLGEHREGLGEELVKLLGTFPQVEATQTLVRYAVVSPFLSVQERATAELKKRPLHDYVPTLLAGLAAPMESQYRVEFDSRGNIRYAQRLRQEGVRANLDSQRLGIIRPADVRQNKSTIEPGARAKGIPNGSIATGFLWNFGTELALMELAHRLEADDLQSKAHNLNHQPQNRAIMRTLAATTEQQIPDDVAKWWQWWQDYNQLHYPKPNLQWNSISQTAYVRSYGGVNNYMAMSCFLAGTPVWTESGIRPIDSIQPGDRVLSQDPDTGELCFKVVTGKTLRPPTEASRLTVNGETITTTLGHPLWVTGKGWEMAKHVKEGDQLHGIGGVVNVNSIEPLPNKVEAHNLVVDDFNTYFVGNCGMLVHDNTYRKPTRAVVPGLVP
jgi:pretoxin HINT domain-containing protein